MNVRCCKVVDVTSPLMKTVLPSIERYTGRNEKGHKCKNANIHEFYNNVNFPTAVVDVRLHIRHGLCYVKDYLDW